MAGEPVMNHAACGLGIATIMSDRIEPSPPTSPTPGWIAEALDQLDRAALRRRLATRGSAQGPTMVLDGRQLVNFGSNDYLSLAADPRVVEAAIAAARQEGWGSGASPLVTGRSRQHALLEEELAAFEGAEAALVFPSGFAANAGTIAALVGPGDVVYTDRKNHASLLDGCRLSRADVRVYPHNDPAALRRLVERGRYRRRLIVTDSLFSIDGDTARLVELTEIAEGCGAMLLVDEAHATGVFGPRGRGLVEAMDIERWVHARIGTLSKALASAGGFVAGSRALIDWLANRARSYVFSTAAPPAVLAAARRAVEIVGAEPGMGARLLRRAAALRARLAEHGWNTGASAGQIIPLFVGTPRRALALSAALKEQGFFVPAIRPPTVPEGESCLRVSLTLGHTEAMLDGLVEALELARRDAPTFRA
mgnify:CR=1 FL=1